MSEGRKRSRKSKLEIREDDDFEVLKSETTDATSTVDPPEPKTAKIWHPISDHDYCKPGSLRYTKSPYNIEIGHNVTPIWDDRMALSGGLSVKVEIEVEKLDATQMETVFPDAAMEEEIDNIWRPPNYALECQQRRWMKRSNEKKSIKMCKYNLDDLYSVSEHIAKTSKNPADRIIDIEIRNLWGNVLYTPDEERPHEAKLQKSLSLWEDWYLSSRFLRESPLFYQCYICNVAFWRLQPFREHIKSHNINTLNIIFLERINESVIIASYEKNVVFKTIYILDEDCWRCENKAGFHSTVYKCGQCRKDFLTCSILWRHETQCVMNKKKVIARKNRCVVCSRMFSTVGGLDKHMIAVHSVRSDLVVSVKSFLKRCQTCGFKLFNLNIHNCTKSTKNTSCEHCIRKFSSKHLAVAHCLSDFNHCVDCQICGKVIPTKCLVLEHMLLEHTNNYKFAYKCTLCTNQFLLYMDEMSLSLHKELWHKKKPDKRRLFYEMMPLPTQCLQENVQDFIQTELLNRALTAPETVNNPADVNVGTLISEPPKLSLIATEVDAVVDKVDIKQEPDDNEEVNYDQILLNMFSVDNEKQSGKSKKKRKSSNKSNGNGSKCRRGSKNSGGGSQKSGGRENSIDGIQYNSEKSGSCSKNSDKNSGNSTKCGENSGNNSQISGDCSENNNEPYANIEIKTEPMDDIEIIENPIENIDLNDYTDTPNCIESLQIVRIKAEPIDDSQDIEPMGDQDYEAIDDQNDNTEPNIDQNTELTDDQNEVETLTVKVEPDIDINDIKMENIIIKNEHDESVTRNPIESMDISELVTKGKFRKKGKEFTFEVINSKGKVKKKRVYVCSKCGYTNVHKPYRTHVDSFCSVLPGTQKSSFKCTKCNLTFVMYRNYVLHFESHGFNYMTCPVCNNTFEKLAELLQHFQRHIKSFFVGFQALDKKGREVKSKKAKRLFKCQECRKLVVKSNMFQHWESHFTLTVRAPPEAPKPKPLRVKQEPCELSVDCQRVTMNNKSLEPAVLKAALESLQRTTDMDRECAICYRAFVRRYDVKRHLIEHLLMDAHISKIKNKCFKCQICAGGYPTMERYKFHMREHGCMPIYKCELCNKTFSDSSNFAKHKKTHNVRVLICDLCNKKFHSKPALEKHIIEHSTDIILCVPCNKTLPSRAALKRHRYKMHEKPKYRCMLCDLEFDSLKDRWDHNWEVHKERKDLADCPICFKSFRKFHQVKVHAKTEHHCNVKMIKENGVRFYSARDLKVSKIEMVVCNESESESEPQSADKGQIKKIWPSWYNNKT